MALCHYALNVANSHGDRSVISIGIAKGEYNSGLAMKHLLSNRVLFVFWAFKNTVHFVPCYPLRHLKPIISKSREILPT